MSRRTTTARAVLIAALAAGSAVACSKPKATCSDFVATSAEVREHARDEDTEPTATVMLIDVADNSPSAAAAVATEFEDEISTAVADGGWLIAQLSGGDGGDMAAGVCFEGTDPYLITSENDEAERDNRDAGVAVLTDVLATDVRGTTVGPRGSAVRLLSTAPGLVRAAVGAGVPEENVTVVLHSDLLGVSDDCLNLDGMPAQPGVAQQIVDACFANGEIGPLPAGVDFTITATVGARAESTAQATLSTQVAELLRERLSPEPA